MGWESLHCQSAKHSQLSTIHYHLHNQYVAFCGVKNGLVHLDCRTIALDIIKAVVVQEEKLCEMEWRPCFEK